MEKMKCLKLRFGILKSIKKSDKKDGRLEKMSIVK
jgi:hypothetical protein